MWVSGLRVVRYPKPALKYFALQFFCCQLRYKLFFCDFPQSGKRAYIGPFLLPATALLANGINVWGSAFMPEKLAVRPSVRFHNAPRFFLSHGLFILAFLWVVTIPSISYGWSQRQGLAAIRKSQLCCPLCWLFRC
jgi:hypothetical protein